MTRTLKLTCVAVISLAAALIVMLVGVMVWVIATESGTQFAWQRAQGFFPHGVEVKSLEGRLAGPLEVMGLTVHTDAIQLELDSLTLEWRFSRLFRRVLDIERITVAGVRYTQQISGAAKPKEESKPFKLPQAFALPVDVRLGQVQLRDFEFRSQPDSAPFVIDTAILTGTASRQTIVLSSLTVDAPLFFLEGNAHLATDRGYLLNGELGWRLPVPGYPTISGNTQINGSPDELTIHLNIAEPYDIQADAVLRDLVDDLKFGAALDVKPLKLQVLNAALPPMTVQLGITGQGDPNDMAFNLNAWVEDPGVGRVNAILDAGLESRTLALNQLKITVPDQPAQLEASGRFELVGEQDFNFEANWHDLQWPLEQSHIKSPKGHVAVTGKIDAYSLDMQANVTVPKKTDAQLLIKGRGNKASLDLSHIDIKALEGALAGRLKLRWKPEMFGTLELDGQGLNPGVILKEWPGKLGLSLRAQGGVKGSQPHMQLEQFRAQGQLRGYALALDAAGAYEGNRTTLKRLELSSGSTRLQASGNMSDTLDLSWQLRSEDLGTLLPDAKGRVDGGGRLAGMVKRPHIQADLTVDGLVFSDYRLKSLILDADVDLAGQNPSRVSLSLQGGKSPGVELRTIALSGQGDLDAHGITLAVDTSQGQADLALQGGLQHPWQPGMTWHVTLDRAKLSYPGLDGWTLQSPSTGRMAATHIEFAQSCWQSGDSLLCLQGRQSAEGIEAGFELSRLPLAYFAHYLPQDIVLQGQLSGKGTFSQTGSQAPAGMLDLKTTLLRVLSEDTYPKEEKTEAVPVIEFQPGHVQVQLHQGGLQASMALPLSASGGVDLQAAVAPGDAPLMDRPLKGKITTEVENLAFIADLIPEVHDVTGRLTGDMTLAGSLASPLLKGRLELAEGAAGLERPGLNLKDIRIALSAQGDGGIRLNAYAVSEEGELNLEGSADLRGRAPKADIQVKGKNFRVINTQEATVDISPDLTLTLRGNRVDVEGDVVIPKTQIKLKTLPESAVKVSNDQVIVSSAEQEKAKETAGREIHGRVRIILGDAVRFDGFGLNARIEGNLLAVEKPGEPTTGSGELRIVDGEYRAYGQGLVIEKGRVLFAGGPIGQPGLDVRAVRRPAEGILVGVKVRGDLKKPDFTLFSDPTMTQGNQLAYLVLGRPLSGTTGNEGSVLSRAALTLGLSGGNRLAGKIGDKLGLDQFGLEPGEAGSGTSPEQASFLIGKYLTPKLYVSYGLGLFDPVSTVRLQYAINSRWKLVTESSGAVSGGDLIYTIEAGR